MKKKWILFALVAALLLSAAGCGSGSGGGTAASVSEVAMDSGWSDGATQIDEPAVSAFSARRENAKLILRAELSLETEDFGGSIAAIDQLTQAVGGYYESSGSGGEAGSRYANYVVRVPQAQFESFLAGIGERCHVVDKQQYAEDVAEQYADLETRLATQKTKHERLLALLSKADKMEDIIALENALAETEYEIDSLTGQKRAYDSLVDFSTVSLNLREVLSLTAVSQDASFGAQLRRAAASGLGGLGAFLRGLLLTAVTIWPLLLIAAAVIIPVLTLRRRKKAKQSETDDTSKNDKPQP